MHFRKEFAYKDDILRSKYIFEFLVMLWGLETIHNMSALEADSLLLCLYILNLIISSLNRLQCSTRTPANRFFLT